LGTDTHVRLLLPYILRKFEEGHGLVSHGCTTLGRHGDLWVTAQGLITAEGIVPREASQLLYIPRGRRSPDVAYTDVGDGATELAQVFARLYPAINTEFAALPLLGWVVASMIKPILLDAGIRMPNVSVYGTKGCGKSSTIRLLLKLVGIADATAMNCRTTAFVMLSTLSTASSIPVYLGEFRTDMQDINLKALRTWLLMSYDTGFDARGRPDQTILEYPLSAPIIIDGEDLFDDPAVQERMLVVALHPETIAEGSTEWQAFEELSEYPLEGLALPLVRFTLSRGQDWAHVTFQGMHRRTHDTFPGLLPDRVRRNIAVCMTGWQLFCDFMRQYDIDFIAPYPAAFSECVSEIVNTRLGRTETQVDDFVVDCINHASTAGQGYTWKYERQQNVLWIHLASAIAWWYKHRRAQAKPTLGTAAIKRQLHERQSSHVGPGQYVSDIKSVNMGGATVHAYGIQLDVVHDSGFDTPDHLEVSQVTIKLDRPS
jgi:hypothetical protein